MIVNALRTSSVFLTAILFLAGGAPVRASGGALDLVDVLRSVEKHYPLLQAANQEREIANARLLSRQGAFDARLGADSKLKPEGFYETYQGNVYLAQPLQFWGTEILGGYRIGSGDFAVWNGGDETNSGGEVRLGIKVPLLRDRSIDQRRASLRKAEVDALLAEPVILENRIEFTHDASLAYWRWVATGMRLDLARQLVAVAEERQSRIARRVDRGALPSIDLADNERLIVDRRVRLISAERSFEQAAIGLSLFLRDDDGNPALAMENALPDRFPEEGQPSAEQLGQGIERALQQQPFLQDLSLQRDKAAVDLELAENQLLPTIAVSVGGSKDFGASDKTVDDKGPAVLEAGVRFDLPLQRRRAKGAVSEARAKLTQIESKWRFARDKIEAKVRSADAGLRAAYDQVAAARRNLELAQRLRKAEERKLSLGTSNLINVNIRELQAFDAAATLIETQADYFRALAGYRAATGDLDYETALTLN